MKSEENHQEDFFPKGAIAFFIALIILFSLMWFSIYFEILNRI